jgi:hypothetical protein
VDGMADRTEEIKIRLLLEALFQKYHFDFRGYAMASLKRRLKRGREHLGFVTISAIQNRLLHDATTLPQLSGSHRAGQRDTIQCVRLHRRENASSPRGLPTPKLNSLIRYALV